MSPWGTAAICAKPTAGGDVDFGRIGRRDLDLSDAAGLCSLDAWVRSQPYADFIPAASRALYTLPRPMFSAVAMSVTERPALKSFTASSALSRADGLRPV